MVIFLRFKCGRVDIIRMLSYAFNLYRMLFLILPLGQSTNIRVTRGMRVIHAYGLVVQADGLYLPLH